MLMMLALLTTIDSAQAQVNVCFLGAGPDGNAIRNVTPSVITAGRGAFTLSVETLGVNVGPLSIVRWNGQNSQQSVLRANSDELPHLNGNRRVVWSRVQDPRRFRSATSQPWSRFPILALPGDRYHPSGPVHHLSELVIRDRGRPRFHPNG